MTKAPRADLSGSITHPQTFLAIKLLTGARYVAHLCEREPRSKDDIANCSIGPGVVDAQGGNFRILRSGWVKCVAYVVDGHLITTRPSITGAFAREGEKAKIGAIVTSAPAQ